MPTMSPQNAVVTLINVFTVEPERQQRLVDVLIAATQAVTNKLPGYVSTHIHRGLDGQHVAQYAQWRSRADVEAMLQHPEVRVHLVEAAALASFEPVLYEVVYSDTARHPADA